MWHHLLHGKQEELSSPKSSNFYWLSLNFTAVHPPGDGRCGSITPQTLPIATQLVKLWEACTQINYSPVFLFFFFCIIVYTSYPWGGGGGGGLFGEGIFGSLHGLGTGKRGC